MNEMSTTTDDCEFCKTSFGDLCCGCRFIWNSQTVQLFHCDREILAAQITKLENFTEELNLGAVISTGVFNPGAEVIDHLGQDSFLGISVNNRENTSHNLDIMDDYSDCTSQNTIDQLHDYALEDLDCVISNWSTSSPFFLDVPEFPFTHFEEMIFNSDIEDEDTMEEEWLEQLEGTSSTNSEQEVEFILGQAEVQVPVQENPMGNQARREQLEEAIDESAHNQSIQGPVIPPLNLPIAELMDIEDLPRIPILFPPQITRENALTIRYEDENGSSLVLQ